VKPGHHAVLRGWVSHVRLTPRRHSFRYRMSMLCLDLDTLDTAFEGRWLWSTEKANLASFQNRDHLDGDSKNLAKTIRDLVAQETGTRPSGSIQLITQARYFGYVMNPISLYLCHDTADRLQTIVAEVHNTPWGERHPYVLPVSPDNQRDISIDFDKALHVSPFMPMDMHYRLRLMRSESGIRLGLDNYHDDKRVFSASMNLESLPMDGHSLAYALAGTPFMSFKIIAAIYWEAFRLWLKRTPYIPYPGTVSEQKEST
jgi:DUF1365 family protein